MAKTNWIRDLPRHHVGMTEWNTIGTRYLGNVEIWSELKTCSDWLCHSLAFVSFFFRVEVSFGHSSQLVHAQPLKKALSFIVFPTISIDQGSILSSGIRLFEYLLYLG